MTLWISFFLVLTLVITVYYGVLAYPGNNCYHRVLAYPGDNCVPQSISSPQRQESRRPELG